MTDLFDDLFDEGGCAVRCEHRTPPRTLSGLVRNLRRMSNKQIDDAEHHLKASEARTSTSSRWKTSRL
jgi:hypothetical protein